MSHSHYCRKSRPVPLKEFIRHFTPTWHALNMGTGAITALFHAFPYGSDKRAMQITALCFLLLNAVLFVIITACAVARYTMYRGLWSSMIYHPIQSLYLGCFPMGFATIIITSIGIVYSYFGFGGTGFLYTIWALWWIDVAVSLIICFGQLHIMFTRQVHESSKMTMVWLLPIVTLTVVSSAGGIIAQAMIPVNVPHVCLTLAICMMLNTIGIMFALAVFTIYIHRLIVFGLPTGITIYSAFLPLGPLAQSGYAYLLLGEISRDLFPILDNNSANIFANEYAPHIIYTLAWLLSFGLWSLATSWLLMGFTALGDVLSRTSVPFKITFWGMIFPNGVYANLTIQLAGTIDSRILRVWGSIYAVGTLALWIFAIVRTVPAVWDGSVFEELSLVETEAELVGEASPTSMSSADADVVKIA